MGDLIIRGGEVVDGSGAASRRADVRVRDGVVVEVDADLVPDGEIEIDAAGAVVTPGFIDTHAHTDPQVFWDPTLDPDSLHGVTTMLTGNCSLALYPVRDDTRAAVADIFAFVEDVPRDLFDDCVPWSWQDYAGYRDAVNAIGTGVNLAPLAGHSPIRLYVMGEDAWHRPATADEIADMSALLGTSLRAGAWGLSTSYLDVDAQGRPVPSRVAEPDEFDALIGTVGRTGRGVVEVVPNLLGGDAAHELETLGRLCGRHGVPLTWTGFVALDGDEASTMSWIELVHRLRADGAQLYPQMSPRPIEFRLNWDTSMMFMSMPEGWNRVITARGTDAKAALLSDPDWRAAARSEWDHGPATLFPHRRLQYVRIVEVFGADNDEWLGRTAAELVAARGGHPSDVLADFVLANDCRPGLVASGTANSDADGVGRMLAHPDVLISSSDAGAHLQMLCASGDTTLVLTRHVRDRNDLSLEQAVYELTGRQADVFGFTRRGRVGPGHVGDLNVFALEELTYEPGEFVTDLPNGGRRLRRPAGGYRATIVDGVAVQIGGELTGALPGRVISSLA